MKTNYIIAIVIGFFIIITIAIIIFFLIPSRSNPVNPIIVSTGTTSTVSSNVTRLTLSSPINHAPSVLRKKFQDCYLFDLNMQALNINPEGITLTKEPQCIYSYNSRTQTLAVEREGKIHPIEQKIIFYAHNNFFTLVNDKGICLRHMTDRFGFSDSSHHMPLVLQIMRGV